MRELDEFVKGLTGGSEYPNQIIDHDFAPAHTPLPQTPGSLAGFDRELERLRGEISPVERSAEGMIQALDAAQKVIAVEAGSLVIGENIAYEDFVKAVIGAKPETSTAEELEEQKEAIAAVVSRMGYKYDASDRERFLQDQAIVADVIEEAVLGLDAVTDADLAEAVGDAQLQGLDRPRLIVEHVKDPYQGYFGIDEEGRDFIRANSNPVLTMSSMDYRAMLDHEKGHAFSTGSKRRAIKSEEISPTVGVVPVFSSRYMLEEVIARSVEEYNLAKITRAGGDYEEYVYRNIKYINDVSINMMVMANSGYSAEEVAVYGSEYLPFEEPGKIKDTVDMYKDGLIYKSVFAIDSQAIELGRSIAGLPEKQRRNLIGRVILLDTLPASFLAHKPLK
jgi:hypothetical protein